MLSTMGEVDSLLAGLRRDGVTESEGVFTIDFEKAREKLARFQLPDPHELVLKFVQAANLEADSICIDLRQQTSIFLEGWNPELTLGKLADRLASGSLVMGDGAVDHLCVGLSALLGMAPEGVVLRQSIRGVAGQKVLSLSRQLEWEQRETPEARASLLIIEVPGQPLSSSRVRELLEERCAYSKVPIELSGQPVRAELPQSSGAHRGVYFRTNEQLACLSLPQDNAESGEAEGRQAELRLTVDLDPMATVWLTRAGVMAQRVSWDLGVPGVVAVVEADGLETDLTGTQFLEGEKLQLLRDWTQRGCERLLEEALRSVQAVETQAQPVSSSAPIRDSITRNGCVVSVLGLLATFWGWDFSESGIMAVYFFWIAFPLPWTLVSLKLHGCEKDEESDKAGRDRIAVELLKAQSALRSR